MKTVGTLIEKLQRERSMSLRSMQDVAGARVVVDGSRRDQDAVVARVTQRFTDPAPKVVDRRIDPTHGYRAVHVVVREAGCLVEIQVRTTLQDLWAQVVERLADIYGRQIRYGEAPLDPHREMHETEPAHRDAQDLIGKVMKWATVLDAFERAESSTEHLQARLGTLRADPGRTAQRDPGTSGGTLDLDAVIEAHEEVEEGLRALQARLHQSLRVMRDAAAALAAPTARRREA